MSRNDFPFFELLCMLNAFFLACMWLAPLPPSLPLCPLHIAHSRNTHTAHPPYCDFMFEHEKRKLQQKNREDEEKELICVCVLSACVFESFTLVPLLLLIPPSPAPSCFGLKGQDMSGSVRDLQKSCTQLAILSLCCYWRHAVCDMRVSLRV